MTQASKVAVETINESDSEESDVIDALIVVAKHKKFITVFTFAIAAIAVVTSLLLPNVYMASTKLLPPQQSSSGASALLAQMGSVANMVGGTAGLKNPNDLYVGMLRSRTVADKIIERFKLSEVYDTPSLERTRLRLVENTTVRAGKDGMITIDVLDRNQKLAAPLANAYTEELLKLTTVLAVTEAAQRRLFYERQLEQAKNNLAAAEVRLKGGLDKHGVISVDAESRALLATVARLRAEASAKEIEISAMRSFVTAENPDFKRANEELKSLRAELSKLGNGRQGAVDDTPSSANLPGFESIKVLRDVKYYEMLYELLAKQYEFARLDEAKDSATIQVLDKAVDPERKSKPKRAIIVIVATVLAFALAVAVAFLLEMFKALMQVPETAVRINELRSYLRFGTKKA